MQYNAGMALKNTTSKSKSTEDRRHLPPLINIDRDIHVLPRRKGTPFLDVPSRCQFEGGAAKIVVTLTDFHNELFQDPAYVVGSKTTAMTIASVYAVQYLQTHGLRIVYDPGLKQDPQSLLRDPKSAHPNFSRDEEPSDPRLLRGENIRPNARWLHLVPRESEDQPLFSATCGIINRKSAGSGTGTQDVLLNYPAILEQLRYLCGNGQRLYLSCLTIAGWNLLQNTHQTAIVATQK